MSKYDYYEIKDFDSFIEYSRTLVFKFFGESQAEETKDDMSEVLASINAADKEEMDRVLSKSECELIAKNYLKVKISKKTQNKRYYLNEKILYDMLESFNSRMISNMLNKLVNDGLLESAYDPDQNDFIFWRKDIGKNEAKESETPETD